MIELKIKMMINIAKKIKIIRIMNFLEKIIVAK